MLTLEEMAAPPAESTMVACHRCGKSIPERGKHGMLQKYCGVTCRTAAYSKRRVAAGWVRGCQRS